jgi:hypothetical protein
MDCGVKLRLNRRLQVGRRKTSEKGEFEKRGELGVVAALWKGPAITVKVGWRHGTFEGGGNMTWIANSELSTKAEECCFLRILGDVQNRFKSGGVKIVIFFGYISLSLSLAGRPTRSPPTSPRSVAAREKLGVVDEKLGVVDERLVAPGLSAVVAGG